ncbi:MAG: RnfABCDGE type electron transport complex subunit D [Alistipes sp.]|nr:RnfABCDGE type electron transport complex subunit D [Alistipes sp.]MBQ3247380.1 RnfABCDGE type electron transport complex subunit D [Alistipes sp.]
MANKFFVSPSPHIHGEQTTQKIMADVIIALLPALCVSTVVYGWGVLLLTAISVASCVLFEFLIQKFLIKGPLTICNLSAALTGLLLAFNLPLGLPWWIVVIGAFVAIAVGKMTFGGLGKNPFNPALVGRVFLLIAYPAQMTTFPAPKIEGFVDSFSGATPLAAAKAQMVDYGSFDMLGMFNGAMAGSVGEIATLALLLGFGYLLWRKVITWHIPVAVLGTMALFAAVYGAFSFDTPHLVLNFSVFHLLAGGAVLGAVYMATDYATSPMTTRGMVIYGVGIGVLTMCIRLWGSYPEGMSFAILIMNAVVPLINKYVKPKRFGLKK